MKLRIFGSGEASVLTNTEGTISPYFDKYRDFDFTISVANDKEADKLIALLDDLFGSASDGSIEFELL